MLDEEEGGGVNVLPASNAEGQKQLNKHASRKSSHEENLLEEDEKENYHAFNKMDLSKEQTTLKKASSYIS